MPTPPEKPSLRLFCIPYAGGSSYVYRGWQRAFPAGIDVCPIELPGRGTRIRDPLPTDLDALVDDILATMDDRLDGPFALFGHSFGAALAFEAATRLEATGRPPAHLAVAAYRAPSSAPVTDSDARLPDAQFREVLRKMGGTPAELLDDDAFMEMAMPVIRADMLLADAYGDRTPPPLSCPVSTHGGADDWFTQADLKAWSRHAGGRFAMHEYPGGHFFLQTHEAELQRALRSELHP
ncbi:thioesterase II family protein [Streptomyces sp. NBC_01304]|uniref:thioesterase II family protein n=1 Tax=Streptomyces sp. NBC_01304 TaxID=2903818 RepID=UPI002E1664D4|nr:alpha/beta fold hydrolase [Streptomyces sp. NBC_01304]